MTSLCVSRGNLEFNILRGKYDTEILAIDKGLYKKTFHRKYAETSSRHFW